MVLFRHIYGGTGENHEKSRARMVGIFDPDSNPATAKYE